MLCSAQRPHNRGTVRCVPTADLLRSDHCENSGGAYLGCYTFPMKNFYHTPHGRRTMGEPANVHVYAETDIRITNRNRPRGLQLRDGHPRTKSRANCERLTSLYLSTDTNEATFGGLGTPTEKDRVRVYLVRWRSRAWKAGETGLLKGLGFVPIQVEINSRMEISTYEPDRRCCWGMIILVTY